jgi:ribose transport system ATP-binding protein
VVHVPEDRREQALFPSFSLEEDVSVNDLDNHRWRRTPFISRRAEARTAERAIKEFGVAAKNGRQPTATLSGGNQQKVVLARWLLRGGRVLVLDEPTQGIDVGTRKEILELVRRAVAQGGCALWISSDFQELLSVSDRLLVMREHEVAGELAPVGLSETDLLHACLPLEERAA